MYKIEPKRHKEKVTNNKILISWTSAFCSLLLAMCYSYPSEAAFRDNFLGARSVAMGGAYTALADEVDGILINPAGSSMIKKQQIIATVAALYMGLSDDSFISQNILGYAYQQSGIGNLGVVWKRLGANDLYSENVLAISFAKATSFYLTKKGRESKRKNLAFGTTLNLMSWGCAPTIGANGEVVEQIPGWRGFSFDIGFVIWPSENIHVAVAIQNVNKPDIASDLSKVAEELSTTTRMGVAAIGESITWAMDMILRDSQIDLRVGLERKYDPNFIIRAGFSLENLAWGTNFTFGAGYKPSDSVRIDYAFVYPVNTILNTLGSHRISVVYNFGQ